MAVYVDTSALVKLVRFEAETDGLRAYLRSRPDQVASVVAAIELARAVRRGGEGDDVLPSVLDRVTLLSLEGAIVERARTIGPATLRTLDAIHLATALELAGELEAFVTYDARLAEAARSLALSVVAPR